MKKVLLVSLFIMFCAVAVVVADPGDIPSDLAILDGATNVKMKNLLLALGFKQQLSCIGDITVLSRSLAILGSLRLSLLTPRTTRSQKE